MPVKSEPPPADVSNHVSHSNEFDRDRRHGDWRLYGYFFQSVHWLVVVLWLIVTAIAATMERMPRKCILHPP